MTPQQQYNECAFCQQVYALMKCDAHFALLDQQAIAKHLREEHNINREWITT